MSRGFDWRPRVGDMQRHTAQHWHGELLVCDPKGLTCSARGGAANGCRVWAWAGSEEGRLLLVLWAGATAWQLRHVYTRTHLRA